MSVDWATLAKQWIAQREAAEVIHHEQSDVLAQPPPPPPPLPVVAADPEPHRTGQEDENSMDISDDEAEGGSKPSAASNNGEKEGKCSKCCEVLFLNYKLNRCFSKVLEQWLSTTKWVQNVILLKYFAW